MANYTMELREYIESWSYDQTISTRDRIEIGRTKLFDFDYPIFDNDYKKVFETHFIRRFYFREIGSETEEKFKFDLETWMLINMPFFNKLFQSELIEREFDPLTNIKTDTTKNVTNDKTNTSTNTTEGTNNTTSDGNNTQTVDKTNHGTVNVDVDSTQSSDTTGNVTNDDFNRQLESDTPDSRLALTATDGEGVIQYASNIKENNDNKHQTSTSSVDETVAQTTDTTTDSTSNTTGSGTNHEVVDQTTNVTSTGNGTINEIEDYLESKTGKIGTQTFASMLNEYRQSFLRIENQIFKEIEKEGLFMLVY